MDRTLQLLKEPRKQPVNQEMEDLIGSCFLPIMRLMLCDTTVVTRGRDGDLARQRTKADLDDLV